MANSISNWLYTGAAPGTQAATKTLAQTTPWGEVGKQVLAEGGYGFGSNNKGFDPKYTGKGATKNPLKYTYEGAKSFGAKVPGNIGGGTPAGRLAFEKLLQSPFAKGVGAVGRYASPLGWGATAGQGIGFLANEYAKATNSPEAYEFLKSMGGANFNFDETNLDVGDIFSNIQKINQKAKIKKQKQNFQNIEAKAAAEAKAKADAAAAAASKAKWQKDYSNWRSSSGRDHKSTAGIGSKESKKGPAGGSIGASRFRANGGLMMADGGLINFYRYGGFI